MKKFYNEPEMMVKIFEAEDIVTASNPETEYEAVENLDERYSTATGNLSFNGTAVILDFK